MIVRPRQAETANDDPLQRLRESGADWSRAPWDTPADMSEASGFLGVVSSELSKPSDSGPEWMRSAPSTEDDPDTRVVTRIGRAGAPRHV